MSYRPCVLPRTEYDTLVVTSPGLEQITAREITTLGVVPAAPERGGIPLRVPLQTLYTLNLNLRTASRITVLIATFRARSFAELERRAKGVAWDAWIGDKTRVQLRVTSRKSKLYHSDAIAERIAAVIAARTGATIAAKTADDVTDSQLVLVRFIRDECAIRVDASGEHLHRRGYRQALAKAPLRETLAAAMLLGSRWDLTSPLCDPFCGSGTIAIEAAMLARRMAPGARRPFAFMRWPNFDARLWRETLARAAEHERRSGVLPDISGFDRDAGAIQAASENAERAGVADALSFARQPLSSMQSPHTPGWIVSNPPYGVRVGDANQLRDLYDTFGRLAREHLRSWHIAILSANPALHNRLAARMHQVFRTTNGGLDVSFVLRVPLEPGRDRERGKAAGSLGTSGSTP